MNKTKTITKSDVGRPLFDGKPESEVVAKLEQVWAIGGTDAEAASYAGIHRATLYRYLKKNEDVLQRKEELLQKPILKARQTVVKALDDPKDAQWYLERKAKLEFGKFDMPIVPVQVNIDVKKVIERVYADED